MSGSAPPPASPKAKPRARARAGALRAAAGRFAAVLAATALLLLWASGPVGAALATTPGADSVSLEWSGGNRVYYGNYNTPIFTSTDTAGKVSFAYCVDATTPPPDPGRYATIPVEEFNPQWARLIRAAMWFSWGGPGFDPSMWPSAWHDGSTMGAPAYYAASHLILSYATTQKMGYVYYNAGSSFISYAAGSFLGVGLNGSTVNPSSTMFQMFARASEVPDGFVCYYLACGQWDYAQYVIAQDYYEPPPAQGSIEVVKSSACPGVTEGNACYSFEGAVFGVYADEACSALVTTITTGPDGHGRADDLDPGPYWVREDKAPAGYALDAVPRRAEVPGGASVVVEAADEPQGVPLALAVQKADAQTGGAPTGGGSLAGALFEVAFYAGLHDAGALPASPSRGWVLATDEQGRATLSEACLVSGDELFRDAAGQAFLPLGTVAVREVRPPAGYELSDASLHVSQVTTQGEGVSLALYAAPVVADFPERGGLSVQKADAETGRAEAQGAATLAGAEFTVFSLNDRPVVVGGQERSAGEAVAVMVTDASGFAATAADALPTGAYRVSETKAPRGYLPSLASWDVQVRAKAVTAVGERAAAGAEAAAASLQNEAGATAAPAAKRSQASPAALALALLAPRQAAADEDEGPAVMEQVVRGGILVRKADAQTGRPEPQGDASLEGAEFSVANASERPVLVGGRLYGPGEVVMTIRASADGVASTGPRDLPYGTYKVQESAAPPGYLLSHEARTVDVREEGVVVEVEQAIPDEVARGGLWVQKADAETGTGGPQGGASYEGAVFEVENASGSPVVVDGRERNPGEVAAVLVTGPDGRAQTAERALPVGTYLVRETQAPEGYLVNESVWEVKVEKDGDMVGVGDAAPTPASAASETSEAGARGQRSLPGPLGALAELFGASEAQADEPDGGSPVVPEQVVRGGVSLQKVDAETGRPEPQGSASLEGARFAVVNASAGPVMAGGRACAPGEVAAYLVTDNKGRAQTGPHDLPFGTYVVYEASAPEGYVADGGFRQEVVVDEDGAVVACPAPFPNRPARGDVSGVKVEDGSSEPMAGVAFLVTSLATGESHVLVADAEGRFSTAAAPHSARTNANDAALGEDGAVVDESLLSCENGVWFSGAGPEASPDDALGAMPFDAYRIDELRTSACYGHELVSLEVSVREDGAVVELGEVGDRPIRLQTSARLASTGLGEGPADAGALVLDAVEYGNLEPGRDYELRAWVVDRDTGEALAGDADTPAAALGFVPQEPDGEAEVEVRLDASALGGARATVLERLYLDGTEVASHADPADDAQTVRFIDVATVAVPGSGAFWPALAAPGSVVLDRVSYRGLEPGAEYTLEGVVVDARTGAPLAGADGKEAASSVSFTPEAREGSVDIEFLIDASNLAGVRGVVLERLLRDGKEVAAHVDMGDEAQACSWAEPQVPVTGDGSGARRAAAAALGGLALACAGALALARTAREASRPAREG